MILEFDKRHEHLTLNNWAVDISIATRALGVAESIAIEQERPVTTTTDLLHGIILERGEGSILWGGDYYWSPNIRSVVPPQAIRRLEAEVPFPLDPHPQFGNLSIGPRLYHVIKQAARDVWRQSGYGGRALRSSSLLKVICQTPDLEAHQLLTRQGIDVTDLIEECDYYWRNQRRRHAANR